MGLRGKCALITGSTGGLGRIVAEHFASEGCNVVLNGVVSESDMTVAVADLEKTHGIKARYAATRDYLAERQPGGRFVSMQSVAALMGFLCGPNSRDISGAAIPLDRGWTVS
jgi:3-hydroxybutyrate dehydrogenase